MMVLSAACSGALAFAALGALGLQLTFVLSGLSYGVSDTGASMLTLWRWAPDVRMQRVKTHGCTLSKGTCRHIPHTGSC